MRAYSASHPELSPTGDSTEEAVDEVHRVKSAAWGLALPAISVVLLGILVWPAAAHAFEVWSTDSEFTYGFLIGPISIALIALRRHAFMSARGPGSPMGLWIVVAAILLSVCSARVGIHALAGLAICPLLWGAVVYVWGFGAGRVLAFPIGFLAFGLGLYRGLLDTVGFMLQAITATASAGLAHLIGLQVIRDGLVLHSRQFSFIVAEECSGMSSLLSLLALTALWVYATHGSIPGRLALILGVLPLVIVANSVRVTLVMLVASWYGQDAALGFFHGASSLVLFGCALGGLLLLSRVVGCKQPSFALQF